jgi:hypothetical protein
MVFAGFSLSAGSISACTIFYSNAITTPVQRTKEFGFLNSGLFTQENLEKKD